MDQQKSISRQPAQKSSRSTISTSRKAAGFTEEERLAMKARVRELKNEEDGVSAVLSKIAGMPEPDRSMAKRLHAIITSSAPDLTPKLWYGMPAYYRDGKLICHFQDAKKFKTRYATIGFSDKANLDEDSFWPVAFALKELNPAVEAKVISLVKKALS